MIDAGATVDDVRHVLGHHTEATTRLYLRRDPPGLREAMEGRRYLPVIDLRRDAAKPADLVAGGLRRVG